MLNTNILFLPGMMCDERVFAPQINFLHSKANCQVAKVYDHDTFSSMSKNIIANQTFDEFILCGLSMGGILAMEILKQYPSKVKGLILIDTNYLDEAKHKQLARDEQLDRLKKGGKQELEHIIKEEMKPFYLANQENEKAKELYQLFFDMAMGLGDKVFINQSLALRNRISYEQTIKTHAKPTLIICGENDPLCPPIRHQQLHQLLPQSSLHILPQCGHIANLEQANKVNNLIDQWLMTTSFNHI